VGSKGQGSAAEGCFGDHWMQTIRFALPGTESVPINPHNRIRRSSISAQCPLRIARRRCAPHPVPYTDLIL
jgi:hypothetical protein